MNHSLGVLPLSAEYRGSQNDRFKMDAHPSFYAVYIQSSLQMDCKEMVSDRHSLKSQLAAVNEWLRSPKESLSKLLAKSCVL